LVFSAGGWKLAPRGRKAIQQIADELKSLGPGPALLVTGYSSNVGTQDRRLALSRQRADFVARALTNAGVPRAKITVRGLGSENPIADNSTKEGRVKNQRVEVEFQMSQEGLQ
jgi:outer membrane protein OmpA-like peptidoglycan-associated protein